MPMPGDIPITCKCSGIDGICAVKMLGPKKTPTLVYNLRGVFVIRKNKPVCVLCEQEPMSSGMEVVKNGQDC